jgi:hypothetical protein
LVKPIEGAPNGIYQLKRRFFSYSNHVLVGYRMRRAWSFAMVSQILGLIAEKFNGLRASFRWEGPWITSVHVTKTALKPLIEVNRFLFFETDLTKPLAQVEPRIPLEIRLMTPGDIEAFAPLFNKRGLSPEEIDSRLTRRDKCILACSGAELVGFYWLGFSNQWIQEIGVTLRLASGEAYGYDAVTFPAWRGNRIHPAMDLYRANYARAHGYARYVTYIRADNPPSLRTAPRTGRKRTKTIWSVRLLGRERPILLLGAKGAGSPSFDTAGSTGGAGRDEKEFV